MTVITKKLKFCLILLPEFTLLPYASFIEKLRFSADDEDYSQPRYLDWTTKSVLNDEVLSSAASIHKATILKEEDINEADVAVFFGGRNIQNMLNLAETLNPFITVCQRSKTHIVAIDNAVFPIAKATYKPLLKNGVVVHWRHLKQFEETFPNIQTFPEKPFNIGSSFSSCVSGIASVDLAIEVLSKHLGRDRAVKGLSDMITEQQRTSSYVNKTMDIPLVNDAALHRALIILNEKLFTKTSIDEISCSVGISRRQLDRKFIARFKVSAHIYFNNKKLSHAKWLLKNTSTPVSKIAYQLGFEDLKHFRKQFKKQYNSLPSDLR